MLKALRALLSPPRPAAAAPLAIVGGAAAEISAPGAAPFPFAATLQVAHGLPVPDWQRFRDWLATLAGEADRAAAWREGGIAWLQHLRDALCPGYRVARRGDCLILSSLEARPLAALFDFVERSGERLLRVLAGLAAPSGRGPQILIVFDDEDAYYRYVSRYYPEDGEFAFSGGMHIDQGCGHFVTVKADLRTLEPVIVHEMTHGFLAHLPLPAWLNEGIAVNAEQRLAGHGGSLYGPRQMDEKHRRFWGETEVQQFWSGASFLRSDEGNLLSYDLARILVGQLSADWERFRVFATSAAATDAGAAAARRHLGLSLGAAVAALLGRDPDGAWEPDPGRWPAAEPAAA